jgi:ADP-ribose pyrophosphatase YjhB (NUDIX family)
MKIIVPGVRAIVLDSEQRLLLEMQSAFGSWALPHGCVDLGESALDAVIRETYEETGIEIVEAGLFGIYTSPDYSVTYPNGDEVQTFTIAFLAEAWQGELRPDYEEVSELGFFPLDELPAPIYPIHADTINDLQSFQGKVFLR